ncbi:MAG TPA: hypothetical protein VK846_14030, partial [Candidatus Limnocylindria bacterium]|nr:hypothetical protein [Candidatus Limnocylindria bacterium]
MFAIVAPDESAAKREFDFDEAVAPGDRRDEKDDILHRPGVSSNQLHLHKPGPVESANRCMENDRSIAAVGKIASIETSFRAEEYLTLSVKSQSSRDEDETNESAHVRNATVLPLRPSTRLWRREFSRNCKPSGWCWPVNSPPHSADILGGMWLALTQIKSSDIGRRVKAVEALSREP